MSWQDACEDKIKLGPSLLQVYAGKAKQAEISLAVGEPEEDPALEVVAAVNKKTMTRRHAVYTAAGGSPELLAGVVEAFREMGLFGVTADTVLVSHGAKLLIDVAMRALCCKDYKVFWFGPGYTYGRAARENGFESVMIPTDSNFDPDFVALEQQLALAQRENRLGPLVINNPVNPTGRVFDQDVLTGLARLARKFDLAVIADETYGGLVFPHAKFIPFATFPGMSDRTVTICSGSKEMRMPGYRFGYCAGPAKIISAMRIILGDCVGCPNVLTQAGALVALKHRRRYGEEQMPALIQKRQLVLDWCAAIGLPVGPIDGAYYAFVDFSSVLSGLELHNTVELAECLFAAGVGIIPGDAFTDSPGLYSNWARISLAGDGKQLVEGLSRISSVIGKRLA